MSDTYTSLAAELSKPLDRANIASRSQSGQTLSYIEGHHAIREANRIFGFTGWDRVTEILNDGRPVQESEIDSKWRVGYNVKVRIIIRDDPSDSYVTVREGVGSGQGIDKDLLRAHESAIKEAETDAMKRALMTFGDPFGLALYDKKQEHVAATPAKAAPTPEQIEAKEFLNKILSKDEFKSFMQKCKAGEVDWATIAIGAKAVKVESWSKLEPLIRRSA